MGKNTNKYMRNIAQQVATFVLPKRISRYFSLLIISYVIVGCASGLYLLARSMMLGIELGKFVQYPIAIPFLVNFFLSFFMIYVCIMIKTHLQNDQKLYKEDTYLLYCMMATQILFLNYVSFIPTLLIYLNLRKNMFFTKERYPNKSEQNKFIPAMTEGVFYYICFIMSGLTLVFALLVAVAFLQK